MSREFRSPSRVVERDSYSYIIAEIGNNHQGCVDTCITMFAEAKKAGADAVKLQKRNNKEIFTADAYNAPYNSENAFADTYGLHRDFLEFDAIQYKDLMQAADNIGITLFATAFDFSSADFLEKIDCPMYKIASGDLRSLPLIKHVASFGKPVIISTGGASYDSVSRVYEDVSSINSNISILQCTAAYPCAPEDMNLAVIPKYAEMFSHAVVGLSSHDNGIALPLVAQTLGAQIFEKHFTLNRAWKGTDHAFSLTPDGLRRLVRDLARAKDSIGLGEKKMLPVEEAAIIKMGKKLVASNDLSKGTVINESHVCFKSPGDGLFPDQIELILGRELKHEMHRDQAFSEKVFE
ncbi:MAG: N-acetylneuraminate synthase family protein [Paracoccaceae bacterium]